MNFLRNFWVCGALLGAVPGTLACGQGATIAFDSDDFTLTPQFNRLRNFAFTIELADPIVPGGFYVNPPLVGVDYNVFGILDTDPTPSGFPAFDLRRSIAGDEFYAQGSSLRYEVSANADLSDGLQVAELVDISGSGNGLVFEFDGREVGTGRYHPSLLRLYADGTGLMQNSNNTGGINPGNNMPVDVTFGEEYIVDLAFDPNHLTLVAANAIPEPGTAALIGLGGVGFALRRRGHPPCD